MQKCEMTSKLYVGYKLQFLFNNKNHDFFISQFENI